MRSLTPFPQRISISKAGRASDGYRLLHTKQAQFITRDHQGSLVTQKVDVDLGQAHEAFTMIPKEIGLAFRAGIPSASLSTLSPKDPDKCPLTFYHGSRYFAHGKKDRNFWFLKEITYVCRIITVSSAYNPSRPSSSI